MTKTLCSLLLLLIVAQSDLLTSDKCPLSLYKSLAYGPKTIKGTSIHFDLFSTLNNSVSASQVLSRIAMYDPKTISSYLDMFVQASYLE